MPAMGPRSSERVRPYFSTSTEGEPLRSSERGRARRRGHRLRRHGFSASLRYGCKRFYLKWCGEEVASARVVLAHGGKCCPARATTIRSSKGIQGMRRDGELLWRPLGASAYIAGHRGSPHTHRELACVKNDKRQMMKSNRWPETRIERFAVRSQAQSLPRR